MKKKYLGLVYGLWTVIGENTANGEVRFLICKCRCGSIRIRRHGNMTRGGGRIGCGCNVQKKITHGMSGTPTYYCWGGILDRCQNPKSNVFKYYGGRGISVCKRWKKFVNFLADMGKKPLGMSIDRINSNGNYCPKNCRWADKITQARNTRGNRVISYRGVSKCMAAWAEETGIKEATIRYRISSGWPIDRTLSKPARVVRAEEALSGE